MQSEQLSERNSRTAEHPTTFVKSQESEKKLSNFAFSALCNQKCVRVREEEQR